MNLTKIVATIGPAVESLDSMVSLINAGASVFRFNLKHNTHNWHSERIIRAEKASQIAKKPIAILLDLPGPHKQDSLAATLKRNLKDLSLAGRHEVDFVVLSYILNKKDVKLFREQVKKLSLTAKILAKIETKQALKNFEEILDLVDGVMIGRGDLGRDIPVEQVPYYQKKIIKFCLEAGKPVITATEMLKSMVSSSIPTRAEVSDIANAVLDNTDAIMLSEETALGKYPFKAVSVMKKTCCFWQRKRPFLNIEDFDFDFDDETAAICYSAFRLWKNPFYQKEKIKAFVVINKSGRTVRMLSRLRPSVPILALTKDKSSRDQLCLCHGVIPLLFKEAESNVCQKGELVQFEKILSYVENNSSLKKGDKIIFLYVENCGLSGKASIIRIQEI